MVAITTSFLRTLLFSVALTGIVELITGPRAAAEGVIVNAPKLMTMFPELVVRNNDGSYYHPAYTAFALVANGSATRN